MRFDHVASHKLLRMRIVTNAEAGAQSAMLAALIGAALTLLLVGAVYNLSLALAVRRQFLLWHGVWAACVLVWGTIRSEEHTSELQSLMRISYAVFCLKKKNTTT